MLGGRFMVIRGVCREYQQWKKLNVLIEHKCLLDLSEGDNQKLFNGHTKLCHNEKHLVCGWFCGRPETLRLMADKVSCRFEIQNF